MLAGARTSTCLPTESAGRIAFLRLWPIGAFALVSAGLAFICPQVAVVGAGYAILVALAWRGREHAVTAIEERDGVRFYVEPSSAFPPVKLVRTPGWDVTGFRQDILLRLLLPFAERGARANCRREAGGAGHHQGCARIDRLGRGSRRSARRSASSRGRRSNRGP